MHIVVLPSWYPSDSHDAAGSFFREQAIALKESGMNISVLAVCLHGLRNYKAIFKQGIAESVDSQLPTHRLHLMRWLPRSDKFDAVIVTAGLHFLFKRYIKKYGLPDVIHAQCALFGGVVAQQLSAKYGIPYIVTEHCSIYARGLVSTSDKARANTVFEHAHKLIAVSKPFAEDLKKAFDAPHQTWGIIPNMVEQRFLDDFENTQPNTSFSFISIGSLNKNKAIDTLIRAFHRAFKGNEQVTLTIAGDGVERMNLEALSSQLQLTKQIKFIGSISRQRALEEIKSANALVSASLYETFGVVLIEALALGKPVIATRCGGPETIVTDKVGLLADKNSVDSLSIQLTTLYQNYNQYDPEAIHNYCQQNYSKQAYTNLMRQQFNNVIKKA
ncbi:glycosyl transferase family 1 [Pseudoalteromonas sp. A25]|uniref:glycosyltransferase n=1 Tax=Pseudoalteromonas sp. A25 TaxID=116092 RepID=UPI001260818E|nr:glycosyltransferase [Pseudoalteromonas sp. A25]BBN80392.1 glycosyl transferase family 1 [Pseudoalteromonas sp. A25]